MSISISKEVSFDAGHRVPNHTGHCKHPHGHRYRVIVRCKGEVVEDPDSPRYGMLVDFGDLKTMLMDNVHAAFDHKFIVHKDDAKMRRGLVAFADTQEEFDQAVFVFPYVPTAENIARWIFNVMYAEVAKRWKTEELEVYRVQVFETPTSSAVVELSFDG